jgi:hypothetical protein
MDGAITTAGDIDIYRQSWTRLYQRRVQNVKRDKLREGPGIVGSPAFYNYSSHNCPIAIDLRHQRVTDSPVMMVSGISHQQG